jgi:hypothetical protein
MYLDGSYFWWGFQAGTETDWKCLGKSLAVASAVRAKEREKQIKVWLEATEAHRNVNNGQQSDTARISDEQLVLRRGRRGRRGLASSTISLRYSPPPSAPQMPSIMPIPTQKIRVLPSLPTFLSLSLSTQPSTSRSNLSPYVDFERGWVEGLRQLQTARDGLRQSWKNGTRVLKFCSVKNGGIADGLDGLVDVTSVDFVERDIEGMQVVRVPVLCLAGSAKEDWYSHKEGCGHEIGRGIWGDDT